MRWLPPLAIAAAALTLAVGLGGSFPTLAGALVLAAGAASAWALAVAVRPLLKRDPYDLGELRRVHEEETLRELDDESALGLPERVVCPRCMTEYPFRAGACPRCGLSG